MAINVIQQDNLQTIPQHYAHIDTVAYAAKPTKLQVGQIQRRMVQVCRLARPYTLEEILKALTSGHTAKLARNEVNNNVLKFQETTLIAIDIDDDNCLTAVDDVVQMFKGELAAYYYSFSHKLKGNRYRLLFQLREPLKQESEVKALQEHYKRKLTEAYEGLTVDTLAANSLVHGTCNGGVIINANAFVRKSTIEAVKRYEYKARIEKEERLKQRAQLNAHGIVPFETLKEAAEKIGVIESGTTRKYIDGSIESSFEVWKKISLSIKSHYILGFIDYSQAWELFSIISGPEANEREFEKFKADGSMSIGTFLKYAQEKGYVLKGVQYTNDIEAFYKLTPEVIQLKKDEYLPLHVTLSAVESNKRILLESPTGSGKTYAVIEALKQVASKNKETLYLYASPTVALTEQVASKYKLPIVKGGVSSANYLRSKWSRGANVYSVTYDQVGKAITVIAPNKPYVLVVDEVHQLTTALNFRSGAINNIISLIDGAKCFIGITGTSADAYKGLYDKHILVQSPHSKSVPAATMEVVRYSTQSTNEDGKKVTNKALQDDIISALLLARRKKDDIRSLVFIKGKKRIDAIKKRLEHEGMKVLALTGETKETKEYHTIIHKGEVPSDIDMVLSTNVISDGVSINNTLNWQCVIVADNESKIFNPSEIRQMSHRFRQNYRSLMLYVRATQSEEDAKPFYRNRVFKQWHEAVTGYCNYLNDEFENVVQLQDLSSVEKKHGIYINDDGLAALDANVLEHETTVYKERYYAKPSNKDIFVQEVSRAVGIRVSKDIFINSEYEAANLDITKIFDDELEVEKTYTASEKEANFTEWFNESVYENIVVGSSEADVIFKSNSKQRKRLKEQIGEARLNAIVQVCDLLPYEATKRHLQGLNRRNETYALKKKITVMQQLATFTSDKKNVTRRLYDALLLSHGGKELTTAEYNELTKETALKELYRISKRRAPNAKEVAQLVCDLFTVVERRDKKKRYKRIKPFDVEYEAATLNLTKDELLDAFRQANRFKFYEVKR